MQVSMDVLEKDFDAILLDAIVLWKNSTKFRHLFTNPERYLIRAVEDVLEEGENLELKTLLIFCNLFYITFNSILDELEWILSLQLVKGYTRFKSC